MHKGDPIQRLQDHFADRLCLEGLPPWAPMLNPVEPLWGWLKYAGCAITPRRTRPNSTAAWSPSWRRFEDDQEFLRKLVPCLGTPAPA